MTVNDKPVLIIGAGVVGLTLAHGLKKVMSQTNKLKEISRTHPLAALKPLVPLRSHDGAASVGCWFYSSCGLRWQHEPIGYNSC